jgi:hypothetical protein
VDGCQSGLLPRRDEHPSDTCPKNRRHITQLSRTRTRTKGASKRPHADTPTRFRYAALTLSPTITVSLRYRRNTLLNTLNASELTSFRQTKLRRSTAFRDAKVR